MWCSNLDFPFNIVAYMYLHIRITYPCGVLHCVALCCSAFAFPCYIIAIYICTYESLVFTMCCTVLHCVAVTLPSPLISSPIPVRTSLYLSLWCVAVRCSLLQYVAVCCSIFDVPFNIIAYKHPHIPFTRPCGVLHCVAVSSCTLQCIAVHCSAMQCIVILCSV